MDRCITSVLISIRPLEMMEEREEEEEGRAKTNVALVSALHSFHADGLVINCQEMRGGGQVLHLPLGSCFSFCSSIYICRRLFRLLNV